MADPAALTGSNPSQFEAELEALRADAELSSLFLAEALDHLNSIEAIVLRLESTPADPTLLNDLFRPFHTIKGNSGALGIARVQELAHQVENLLDQCRSGKRPFTSAEADMVLKAVDVLTAFMHDIERRLADQSGTDLEPQRLEVLAIVRGLMTGEPALPAPAPAPVPTPATTAESSPATTPSPVPDPPTTATAISPAQRTDDAAIVKVETRKLDNLIDMVGELVIVQSIIQEHPACSDEVSGALARHLGQLRRITSDLQRNAMSLRMVPIRQTFQKMARLVRDLSKKSGKSIELVLHGEDTELDRRVVEDINDPLMHMVRNSIDHGIEAEADRLRAGKRAAGTLTLSAYHQGGTIVIEISDDGGGLKADRILAKARTQGLVTADQSLSPSEIHQLIFRPGFSTAEQVTEISGRGVGMDVVKRNIEALRGRIDIQSEVGKGTTFLIKLPLTLAIVDGLILGVGTERYVLPVYAVRESFRPTADQIHSVAGQTCMVVVRERLVRLVRLGDVLGIPHRAAHPWEGTVIVIDGDGDPVGLLVDDLLGRQEVVIKSLGDALGRVAGLAGSAILGDGRVGLILDADSLIDPRWSQPARVA